MKTDLIEIFQTIRASMQPYETLGFNSRINSDKDYDLWSDKNVVLLGKKRNEIYFAGLKIMKSSVTLHFMLIYTNPEMKELLHPDLLKLLKGKSCFHFKKLDEVMMEHISLAFDIGYKAYKQNEWV
ncbi:hypothetical protein [Pedobacter xixiisoli]|uniref:YdhG-like domain-containing protein n=1 Tax=Pedobacter xixiisoli TaxID=1476464 RepID=A0A285ZXM2_9SPHI|nr:hypothetical protein [Pedobacter xixiisoli]SOD14388.1 hypothetical protein SAMN06297358_1549 [Pedobacter xixiisoli]